ncbi:hypothetical protein [Intestinibacillus massiliensis]|uniref:hypothetical protein n=1 Tax=Intestinibacillus massiliensis TaxID=1871029 RepID=UPI00117BACF1|nr:hypothetical protein [Intestinibacillus massiliensis]
MKKALIAFLAVILFTSMTPALAVQLAPRGQVVGTLKSARIEETEWKYRIVNGVYQKRLWSITYGVWRTDWITCQP